MDDDKLSLATNPTSVETRHAGRGRLITTLGVGFGIAVAIGNTIGAGIVRTPGEIAALLPSTGLFFAAWAAGGIYMTLGALQFAELGALLPQSGGQYNFARAALGDYAGFIVGWSDWISTAGSFAAVSIVFGEYTSDMIPAAHGHVRPLAAGVILLFALLQWKSMKVGSGVQDLTTILKAVLFLAVVAVCFFHSATPVTAVASRAAVPVGWPLFVAFIVALQAVIYTYDGWYGVVYFGGEVHNPGRDIPRAIFGTVFSVLAIYFLVNAAVVHLVSVREFAGSDFAMGIAARRVLGLGGRQLHSHRGRGGPLEQRQRDGNGDFTSALRHEPRRPFLFRLCAREQRRDSGALAVAFHRGGPVLCDVQLRAGGGDPGVIFRGRLRAVVRVAVRAAPPHAREQASSSRLRLSVDDCASPRGFDRVPDRGARVRSREHAADFPRARRKLPGVPRAQVGFPAQRNSRIGFSLSGFCACAIA